VGRAGPHARSALLASRPVRRRCHSLHASSCLAPAAPEARSTAVRGPAHRAQQWLAGCSSPAPLPITWRPWLPRSHRVAPAGGARAHAAKVRGPVQRPVRGLPFSQAAPAGGGGAGSCAEAALQLGGSTLVGPGPAGQPPRAAAGWHASAALCCRCACMPAPAMWPPVGSGQCVGRCSCPPTSRAWCCAAGAGRGFAAGVQQKPCHRVQATAGGSRHSSRRQQ